MTISTDIDKQQSSEDEDKNAQTEKPFRASLVRRLARAAAKSGDPAEETQSPDQKTDRLDQVSDALIEKAIAKDVRAACEIANRLDGKVPRAIVSSTLASSPIGRIEYVIVDPKSRSPSSNS